MTPASGRIQVRPAAVSRAVKVGWVSQGTKRDGMESAICAHVLLNTRLNNSSGPLIVSDTGDQ